MSPPLILLCALALDALFGEPEWLWSRLPHPAVLMGRMVSALDRWLNTGGARLARGVAATAILCAVALLVGSALAQLGPAIELLVAAILLAQRSLVEHVRAVARALRVSLPEGREAVSMIVSRNTGQMSESAVSRAAIESASENLSDGVIAPAFWFLLGGLPGLVLYKAVNTADSMTGYRTPRYEAFGKPAARLDDLMNLVPARLTAALVVLSSGTPRAWADIARDAGRHRSPNAGWPEAAMARALDIALAGPRIYDGVRQDLAWVNADARRSAGPADIDAAVRGLWRAWALGMAVLAGIVLLQALPLWFGQ